jgi:hypothetical protein
MALRWSIVTAGLIALFWAIWWLINGSVPVVTSIRMTGNWTLALPFGISRWWDILIGPIGSTAVVFLMTNKKAKEGRYSVFGLVAGLIFGLFGGLVFGLVVGPAEGLVFGLLVGLLTGLIFGVVVGLFAGLIFGLVYGLIFGLVGGLAYGLAIGLAYGLAYVLGGLVVLLANGQLWAKVWNWLMVR